MINIQHMLRKQNKGHKQSVFPIRISKKSSQILIGKIKKKERCFINNRHILKNFGNHCATFHHLVTCVIWKKES